MKKIETIDSCKISVSKKFWKNVKATRKITLVDKGNIISDDTKIAEIMNTYFSNIVENLKIQGYNCIDDDDGSTDQISYTVDKFKYHPIILKIKEKFPDKAKISCTSVDEIDITSSITNLNT